MNVRKESVFDARRTISGARKTVCAALCVALVLALAPQAASADSGAVTGSAAGSQVKIASIRVQGAPEKFLYKASGKGNQVQLTAVVEPADAANKSLKWISGSPTIASVDDNGLVTFHGHEGKLLITVEARDGGGAYAEATILVAHNVTSMRTARKTVYIQRGKSFTLPLVRDDASRKGHIVKSITDWESSNEKVLTVDDGKIKASKKVRKKTMVTVTATAFNGRTLKWKVYVVPKARKLKSAAVTWPKKAVMKKGRLYTLKVKLAGKTATGVKVAFHSSRSSVIQADKAGRLWAKKKGTSVITVRAGGKVFKKKIRVK
jgi:uncharacterized protein YjdB